MRVRHPDWDDAADVLALVRAADEAVLDESDWTADDLREEWEELDLGRDAWLVEVEGSLAGYASIEDRGGGRMLADGYVHPDLRGAGVGSELLRLSEERAGQVAVTSDAPQVYLQNATIEADSCTARLYERRGYVPVRWFWRMVIDLEEAPEPAPPAGVEIRLYRQPDDERAVHAAIQEAFADHWQHRERSWEEWEQRMLRRPRFDPTLWWVAVAEGAIAGAILCDWKTQGEWGWVGTVGVRRRWRRRGIAEALLRTAFGEFFRRGELRVALGVDAESETGATRLYERLGMRIFSKTVIYERALRG